MRTFRFLLFFILGCISLTSCDNSESAILLPEPGNDYFHTTGEGDYRRQVSLHVNLDGVPGHVSYLAAGRRVLADNRWEGGNREPGWYNTLLVEGEEIEPGYDGELVLRGESERSGNARLILGDAYSSLNRWWREVIWGPAEMRIEDELSFSLGVRRELAFRWNLGYKQTVEISGQGRRYIVEGERDALVIECSRPLSVELVSGPTPRGYPVLEVRPEPGHAHYRVVTRILPRRGN